MHAICSTIPHPGIRISTLTRVRSARSVPRREIGPCRVKFISSSKRPSNRNFLGSADLDARLLIPFTRAGGRRPIERRKEMGDQIDGVSLSAYMNVSHDLPE